MEFFELIGKFQKEPIMGQGVPDTTQPSQQTYIPIIAIARITLKHTLYRLPIAMKDAPDHICGTAQRVGYTGTQQNDLAIYRLKVKTVSHLPVITLPGFFVLEQGIFVDYEQWCASQQAK